MSTNAANVSPGDSNLAMWLLNKKNWFTHFLVVAVISIAGLVYLGQQTYSGSPPLANFVSSSGQVIASTEAIAHGKEIFHIRGLMLYGSFWGDGAERGAIGTGGMVGDGSGGAGRIAEGVAGTVI